MGVHKRNWNWLNKLGLLKVFSWVYFRISFKLPPCFRWNTGILLYLNITRNQLLNHTDSMILGKRNWKKIKQLTTILCKNTLTQFSYAGPKKIWWSSLMYIIPVMKLNLLVISYLLRIKYTNDFFMSYLFSAFNFFWRIKPTLISWVSYNTLCF